MTKKVGNVGIKVVGVTFKNDDGSDRGKIIDQLRPGTALELVREPDNKYDPCAIKVISHLGQIGHIPRNYTAFMSQMMADGRRFKANIDKTGRNDGTPYCHIIVNEV